MLVPLSSPPPVRPPRRRAPLVAPLGALLGALLVMAVAGLVTAGTLGAVALADRDSVPEACCAEPVPSGAAVAPSPSPPARSTPLSTCLIGSWVVREESTVQPFYRGEPPRRFTSSGRAYEFRADGTVFESATNVTYTSADGRFRRVLNGTREYTWTATDTTITYLAVRRTSMVWQYFADGRRIDTVAEKAGALNEVGTYTCSARQVVESNAQYRATWERTDTYGVYT